MADFTCTRCGKTEGKMTHSPIPGKLGEKLIANTCYNCWEEWDANQIIVLNENRLNLAVPQHFELLLGEMKDFLKLPE